MLQPDQLANKGSHSNWGICQRKSRLRNGIFKHFKSFPWKGFLHLVGGTSHLPVWSVQTHFLWVMKGSFRSGRSHWSPQHYSFLSRKQRYCLPGPRAPGFSPGCKTIQVSEGHLLTVSASSLPSASTTSVTHSKLTPEACPLSLCAGSVGWILCQPRERSGVLAGSSCTLESCKDPASARAATAKGAEIQTSTNWLVWSVGLSIH